jgi:hypothetical protein
MRHGHSLSALALLLLLSGCATHETSGPARDPQEWLTPWAEFSVRPSLAQRITETIVHVGNLPFVAAGEPTEHWLRKTARSFGGDTRVQWADTRSCAAARAVLSNMHDLEMPRPAEGGAIEVRADGVRYALSTDGRYGSGRLARLSISASGGTPLADWAERSLAELDACWSDIPPAGMRREGANRTHRSRSKAPPSPA